MNTPDTLTEQENPVLTALARKLGVSYDPGEEDKIALTQSKTLRTMIGALGMLLPPMLWLVLWIDSKGATTSVLPSISHYYLTRASAVLVIVVSALAIFLLIYKGKNAVDFTLSSIAGVAALVLLLFPTGNVDSRCPDFGASYWITRVHISSFREVVHYVAAGIFLSALAYMALFLFTKSNLPRSRQTRGKKSRNIVYYSCGVTMVLALSVLLIRFIMGSPVCDTYCLTFWMETIAVEAFGFAWLTKAEVFWKE